MAWRARQRSENRRAGGLKGRDRGWLPGSSQANAIGIPTHLVNKTRERTSTLVTRDAAANIAGGLTQPLPSDFGNGDILIDTRSLVVKTNQLSGIGRYRSQFNVDADGIKYARYYLPINPTEAFEETIGDCKTKCEKTRPNSVIPVSFNILHGITHRHPQNIADEQETIFVYNFSNRSNLLSAIHLWNTDNAAALSTYGKINNWGVGNVVNMQGLFHNATAFNKYIGSWDVRNVVNMQGLFHNATAFNQYISSWDTSKVINMESMFRGAVSFNQNISSWDVGNVVNMQGLFHNATAFNQDIGSWDVRNVVNMRYMFEEAIKFNQDIGSWNVSNVTDMLGMFSEARLFNQNISSWDTSKVINMESMFRGAVSFNQNISSWDVGNCFKFSKMFQNCGLVHNGLLASKASEIQYLYTLTENNTPQERRDAWSNVWNGV